MAEHDSKSDEAYIPQASTSKVVYSPSLSSGDISSTKQLLHSLYSFGKNPGDDAKLAKLLRHTDHSVQSANDNATEPYTITSWKMQDYAYKRDPCPYPTRARGLFTAGKERIVARAYDKFFNVDEVSWTKWTNLPDLTTAPYYLTLKSNGCLILISALSPTELLVTSKHAIGKAREEGAVSHAQVGEKWLEAGLKKVGKTREDLAGRLWQENWTCVAELCDDSFEEHILAYTTEFTGLHLHGLVVNHPTLLTLPPQDVNDVAKEYGFIETAFITLNSVKEVRDFANKIVADGGIWQGTAVEGFVVRAALKPGSLDRQPHPNDLTEDNWQDPRRVFMWKIKFDEPYLMWREWRETTKKILTQKKKDGDDVAKRGREILSSKDGKSRNANGNDLESKLRKTSLIQEHETNGLESSDLPSSIRADKIRNPETRTYAVWVEQYMASNPEAFAEYAENRGIIAVREAFLEWRKTSEATRVQAQVLGKNQKKKTEQQANSSVEKQKDDKFTKTLIVPVAVPGCGKTLLGVALAHLFGFAHTQSDDVQAKKAAKHFEDNVAKLLKENTVVFADKNNHLKQHREAMASIASKEASTTRLVALVWSINSHPQNEIHRICSDRIVGRGEKHQSLRPMKTGEHEVILTRFFGQYEPFDPAFNTQADAPFHEVIEMDILWDFEKALEVVIDALMSIDAKSGGLGDIAHVRPSKDNIKEAITFTQGYKPSIYKEMKVEGMNKANGGRTRYYGIAVEVDLPSLLEQYFSTKAGQTFSRSLFDILKKSDRIERKPHVTLVHEKELESKDESQADQVAFAKMLWEKCHAVSQRWGQDSVEVTLTLGPLLAWDDRAMTIQVSSVQYGGMDVNQEDMPSDERKDSYHITVGTLNQEIRPIEGKWLLERAMKGIEETETHEKITIAHMPTVEVKGRVRGLY